MNIFEIIINFLQEKSPIIVVIIIVGIIVWKIAKFYFNRFKKTEDVVAKLPCKEHSTNIDDIKSTIFVINDIKESVRKIEKYIIKNDVNAMDNLLRKCSPYQITSFGKKFLDISGGKNV